ncbi:MAG TPA: AraC family transcriptional regulator [Pyrinomonadaceae bacterium]
MANAQLTPGNLTAGKFYGNVPQKRTVATAILSEVVHRRAVDVPEHSHELAYFTLLLGGSYHERFGRKESDHLPMTMVWHRAGISHKDRIGPGGARCFTVEIRPGQLEELRGFSQVPPDFAEHATTLAWLGARLFREFKTWDSCSDIIAEGLTLEMLGHALRSASAAEKRPPKWLSMIFDRLNDEFFENISTLDLARQAGVHPVHLASVFRRFYGQTIGEYVQQLRVAHASRLLIGGRSFAEIAYESGFADQSHFNRLFKRHTGMTPGAFRRSLH